MSSPAPLVVLHAVNVKAIANEQTNNPILFSIIKALCVVMIDIIRVANAFVLMMHLAILSQHCFMI